MSLRIILCLALLISHSNAILAAADLNYIKRLAADLDAREYRAEINNFDAQAVPYLLTECAWADCQRSKNAVILLPAQKSATGALSVDCGDAKKLSACLSALISLAKELPSRLISGVDIVPGARRSLPFVLTRIAVSDGKEKIAVNFNEIHCVWRQRDAGANNAQIDKINKFLRAYIDVLEIYNGTRALDCFVGNLD